MYISMHATTYTFTYKCIHAQKLAHNFKYTYCAYLITHDIVTYNQRTICTHEFVVLYTNYRLHKKHAWNSLDYLFKRKKLYYILLFTTEWYPTTTKLMHWHISIHITVLIVHAWMADLFCVPIHTYTLYI
jgi:hypothetical protein